MALTAGGIWYPEAGEPFPSASWWLTHAESEDSRLQSGQLSVSFTSLSSFATPVVFPTPFAAAPRMTANIASGSGPTGGWLARSINVTATGFDMFLHSDDGAVATWTSIPVQWTAMRA